MPIDIYKTKNIQAAIEQTTPVTSFLRDRYFPTDEDSLFVEEEVIVEFKDSTGHKMAPVVLPRKGSISIEREGYSTHRMEPPLVAPSRFLSIDDAKKRQMGESIFSTQTPAQRQAKILMQDVRELDGMITTREEYIAAKCMFNNGYVLKQYADKYGEGEYKEYELRFYGATGNSAVYAPNTMWDAADDAAIFADLHQMLRMLTTKGNNASEVLLGSDVAEVLMKNEKLQKLMDLARYNVGEIAPIELPHNAARLGRLNVRGRVIDLLTYDGTYVDEETGNVESFVPANKICVTAPGAGRSLYGAVSQMEQISGQLETYPGRRVPRYWADKNGRELTVSSHPLLVPKTKDCFITAEVLG